MKQLEHPDVITDWQMMKKEQRGGHQAIEDKALDNYHRSLSEGKTKEEAVKQYFETFKKVYDTLLQLIPDSY